MYICMSNSTIGEKERTNRSPTPLGSIKFMAGESLQVNIQIEILCLAQFSNKELLSISAYYEITVRIFHV